MSITKSSLTMETLLDVRGDLRLNVIAKGIFLAYDELAFPTVDEAADFIHTYGPGEPSRSEIGSALNDLLATGYFDDGTPPPLADWSNEEPSKFGQ